MDEKLFLNILHLFIFTYSPPNGCLQWHTGVNGRFETFNFPGTTSNEYQHLRNQDYRVCIRQEEGVKFP